MIGFLDPSLVTHLEFYQSAIDAALFSITLWSIKGLKRFVYSFWASPPLDDAQWELRQIVGYLEAYTRKTLCHLELTGSSDVQRAEKLFFEKGEPCIGSLCAFEVSKRIRLETMTLYKEIEGADSCTGEKEDIIYVEPGADLLVEPECLVDILPASTCRGGLVGGLSNEDAIAMVEDLPARDRPPKMNL